MADHVLEALLRDANARILRTMTLLIQEGVECAASSLVARDIDEYLLLCEHRAIREEQMARNTQDAPK